MAVSCGWKIMPGTAEGVAYECPFGEGVSAVLVVLDEPVGDGCSSGPRVYGTAVSNVLRT